MAVLPQAKSDIEIHLNPKDLKEEATKSSGKGGQNVNKNETACRITHLPTGIAVKCQEERYFSVNKSKALKYLKQILYSNQYEADMSVLLK